MSQFLCRKITLILLTAFSGAGLAWSQEGEGMPWAYENPDLESESFEVEFIVGFDGHEWERAVTPVAFRIKNNSTEFFEGEVELKIWSGRYSEGRVKLPIELGQNSRRRFSMGVSFDYDCMLECKLVRDGEVVWRKTVPVQTSNSNFRVSNQVLAVSESFETRGADEDDLALPGNRSILRAVPWQLPDHDQILSPLQAIFVYGDVDFQELKKPQVHALAFYVAHGGVIFFPESKKEGMEKVIQELPYDIALSSDGPTPVGLGKLVPHKNQSVGNLADVLTTVEGHGNPLPNYAQVLFEGEDFSRNRYGMHRLENGPRAKQSLRSIVVFMVAYLVLAGPVLFLFRGVKRKRVIQILIIVIGVGSVFSVLLGIFLRTREGDLAWVSVTCAGEGGATQTAVMLLSSAGSKSHRLEVGADQVAVDDHDYLRDDMRSGVVNGSTYNADLAVPKPRGGADVALPPLGNRKIHARGPVGEVKPMKVEVIPERGEDRGANSTLSYSITNPNSFDILRPVLIVVRPDYDFHYVIRLPEIAALGSISGQEVITGMQKSYQPTMSQIGRHFIGRRQSAPRYAPAFPSGREGGSRIVFMAELEESPAMEISGDFVDFAAKHFFLQVLPIEVPQNFGF